MNPKPDGNDDETDGNAALVDLKQLWPQLIASQALGDVRHGLNQPLAAVIANANALLRWLNRPEPDLEEASEAGRRIVDEGVRAAALLSETRDLIPSFAAEPTSLRSVLRNAAALASLPKGAVQLDFDDDDGSRSAMIADGARIAIAIASLIRHRRSRDSRALILAARAGAQQVEMAISSNSAIVTSEEKHSKEGLNDQAPYGGSDLRLARSLIEAAGGRLSGSDATLEALTITLPRAP